MTKQNLDKTEADRHAAEANVGAMKDRMAGVLGGALSRLFERAGLDVRVTSPVTPPPAQGASPASALPARDALLTLATVVLSERLLSARSAPAESRTATATAPAQPPARSEETARAVAPSPAAACDRISDLLGPAVVDPTARPAPRAAAPAVVPSAATRPRAAAVEPATVAPAAPASSAAPAAEKRRGFTLRY